MNINIDNLIWDIERNADDLLSLYKSRFKLNNPIDDEVAIEAVNRYIEEKSEELQEDLEKISGVNTELPILVKRKIDALNCIKGQDGNLHNSSREGVDR